MNKDKYNGCCLFLETFYKLLDWGVTKDEAKRLMYFFEFLPFGLLIQVSVSQTLNELADRLWYIDQNLYPKTSQLVDIFRVLDIQRARSTPYPSFLTSHPSH